MIKSNLPQDHRLASHEDRANTLFFKDFCSHQCFNKHIIWNFGKHVFRLLVRSYQRCQSVMLELILIIVTLRFISGDLNLKGTNESTMAFRHYGRLIKETYLLRRAFPCSDLMRV